MNEKPFNLNQGEEGLDDLFRIAAEAEQPAAPAHAWLKMNLLLDEEEQKRRRGFAWWWLPLLLFMAGHRHFVPQPGPLEVEKTKSFSRQLLQHESSGKESSQKDAAHTAATGTQQSADQKGDASFIQLEKQHLNATPSRKFVSEISTPEVSVKKELNQPILEMSPESALTQEESMPLTGSNETGDNALYPALPKKQQLSLPVSVSIIDPAIPGQTIVPTPKQQPVAYRFYVYGGGGFDRGFVSGNHESELRPAYGAGLGMQLNKRWAMQVGFTQTRKMYEAPGNAYTPKAGSYYDNPNFVIQEVYADCAILEIPISVRYNFLPNQQHQVFGMLSMQNALMQRESYDYYYTRFGQPAKGYYTYRTKALELFSGIGFSVGYEYRISDRLHVQAAPYFSIPTKGIGEGSVKLRSAGLFAGLRYSFWKKK